MGQVFLESFDHLDVADFTKKWTSSVVAGGTPVLAISAGNGGHGSASLRFTGADVSHAVFRTCSAPAPSGPTCIFGCLFKINTLVLSTSTTEGNNSSLIFGVRLAGVTMVWFQLNTDGTISALRGTSVLATSTFALSTGVAYYLEFKITISNTLGVVKFWLNGVLDATLDVTGTGGSPLDTNNGGATDTWNAIKLGSVNTNGPALVMDYDDIYLFDGSGSYNNDVVGPQRIDAIFATAEGATINGTPSTGTDNSALVDEAAANGDTDYVTLAAAGDLDTYVMQNHPVPGASITGMQAVLWARKADAGTALLAPVIRMGGVDYVHGTPQAPGPDYRALCFQYERSPVDGTTALDTTDIDNLEAGPKKTV